MNITNIEFKASVNDLAAAETKLQTLSPIYKGLDHQVDTYFNVPHGRLKLREGNIEHALIQYHRDNLAGAKKSSVVLYKHKPDPALKQILTLQFGIWKVVDKQRKIYFIDHVKFHFDQVLGLGEFMEVEVINENNRFTTAELQDECNRWVNFFQIQPDQFLVSSYSDMV
ncbi:MAG: CYTH domain-containing protein [Sphingobacteriales bacterium]|nr:MAG: CYTH domain-containing protein [Sphingobacteriales bacterium]